MIVQKDRKKQLLWYPMRVTYGREERMTRVKEQLEASGVECFMPYRCEFQKTNDWNVKKVLTPAIQGLIFVHATQENITDLKMTRREFETIHYMTNLFARGEDDKILVVPDRQMTNFMKVASMQDGRVVFLDYTDFIAEPGKRVRVSQGDFVGSIGTIKRIKKNQCVVVQIEGVSAVAIAFVPPAWLEEISEDEYRQYMTS